MRTWAMNPQQWAKCDCYSRRSEPGTSVMMLSVHSRTGSSACKVHVDRQLCFHLATTLAALNKDTAHTTHCLGTHGHLEMKAVAGACHGNELGQLQRSAPAPCRQSVLATIGSEVCYGCIQIVSQTAYRLPRAIFVVALQSSTHLEKLLLTSCRGVQEATWKQARGSAHLLLDSAQRARDPCIGLSHHPQRPSAWTDPAALPWAPSAL